MNAKAEELGPITMRVFGQTDVGQIREHNEDNFLVADLTHKSREMNSAQTVGDRGTLISVCDGMGGAAAGEVASQMAVDIIFEKLADGDPPADHDALAHRVVQAVEEAGARIFNEARADRTRRGMGTTATVAAAVDARLFVAQVGDSRAYILRNGSLVQVSRDQSLVNQLIEAGQLSEEEAETFEHNNIILQALGTAETVQVDLTYVDLRQDDTLLLCSDGLSGMMRSDEIREVLMHLHDPREACEELIRRANMAGGHDNVTVIVAKFDSGLPPASEVDEPVAYRKYPLPEAPEYASTVSRDAGAVSPVPPSDEAAHEERRLRVGHTLVGANAVTGLGPPLHGAADPSATAQRNDDDPVDIPTTGLKPSYVAAMVFAAMLAVAVGGFVLLR